MTWHPKGFGGPRTNPEVIKRESWRDFGILVLKKDDARLSWPEREIIKQIGTRLYGDGKAVP